MVVKPVEVAVAVCAFLLSPVVFLRRLWQKKGEHKWVKWALFRSVSRINNWKITCHFFFSQLSLAALISFRFMLSKPFREFKKVATSCAVFFFRLFTYLTGSVVNNNEASAASRVQRSADKSALFCFLPFPPRPSSRLTFLFTSLSTRERGGRNICFTADVWCRRRLWSSRGLSWRYCACVCALSWLKTACFGSGFIFAFLFE